MSIAILGNCRTKGIEINRDEVIFYIGHETIVPREGRRGIPRWQEAIFAAMASQLRAYNRCPQIASRPSGGNRSRGRDLDHQRQFGERHRVKSKGPMD